MKAKDKMKKMARKVGGKKAFTSNQAVPEVPSILNPKPDKK